MRNLPGLIHGAVFQHPNRDALMWREDGHYLKMTYGMLWKRVQWLAHALLLSGFGAGSKIAILSNNRPEWTLSDLGILMIGGVSVPIYPTLTTAQIDFILQNADVEAIIVENEEMLEQVLSIAAKPLRLVITLDATPPPATGVGPETVAFADLLTRGYERMAKAGELDCWREIDTTALATIVHTSGTTGNPKGVMLTHANLVSNVEGTLAYVPISPEDSALSYLPLSHIFERTCGQFATLSAGAMIAFAESINTIAEQLPEVRPTMMTSVPRLFEKIYDGIHKNVAAWSPVKQWIFRTAVSIGKQHAAAPTLGTRLLHPLFDRLVFRTVRERMGGRIRLLVSGGGSLSYYIAEFFRAAGLPVCEGYGLTETSPVVSTNPIADLRIGTVGRPLTNLQVKLAEDGEVLVKGSGVMAGYYKNPQATAQTFDDEGWLRTGDIGQLDDGYLKIVERKKNILVLATGKNVAPFPVESAIAQSPYILQAVLFGDRRKYVTALIVPDFAALQGWAEQRGLSLDPQDLCVEPALHEFIQREIERTLRDFAPFEQPKKFTLLPRELSLEAGELTVTLKVRTHVLQSEYLAEIEAMYDDGTVAAVTAVAADSSASM